MDDEASKSPWLKLERVGTDTARYMASVGIPVQKHAEYDYTVAAWIKIVDRHTPTITLLGVAYEALKVRPVEDILALMTLMELLPPVERGEALRKEVYAGRRCMLCSAELNIDGVWLDLVPEFCPRCLKRAGKL